MASVMLIVAGSVSDFPAAILSTLCGKIAKAAGLETNLAQCTVTPASVIIKATLSVPAGKSVEEVADSFHSAIGTPEEALAVLGVTVVSRPTVADANGNAVTPTPATPATPAINVALLVVYIVAPLVALVIIAIAVWVWCKKRKSEPISPGSTNWNNGFYDCFGDMETCLCVSCCTPCAYGQMMEMLQKGSNESSGMGDSSVCCTYYCYSAIPYGGPCIVANYAGGNRKKIREKFGLKEEPCNDCMAHLCCNCCATIQEMREVKYRNGKTQSGAPEGAQIAR